MSDVVVVRTDGSWGGFSFPGDFLKFCYREIGCSLVDRISLDRETDMWVDDEGMFSKVINYRAIAICRKFGYPADVIFGDVVICGLDYGFDGADACKLSEASYDKVMKYGLLDGEK